MKRPVACALAMLLAGCTTGSDPGRDASLIDDGALFDAGARPDADRSCEPNVHLGQSCSRTAECNDHCFCNGVEICMDGTCVAGAPPCDDAIECTADTCDEDAKSCAFDADDSACADTNLCNGDEICVPFAGCRPGLRLACADGDACTIGACDQSTGCSYEVRDLDADGYADDRCGGTDCYDDPFDGATVYPGAPEICDNDRDDNCNAIVDYRETTCGGVNDDCASAELLPGPGIYVRTTRGLDADVALGCRSTGPDSVFRFTLSRAQDVEAQLSVDSGSGSVAIRSATSCASGPDAYCGNASVLARNLAAGEYVLIVKTSTPSSFALALTFLDATPVQPVDACNDSTTAITASGTFNGFFSDVGDDYRLACRTTTSTAFRDAAYRLVLTESSDVRISATTAATSSTSTYVALVRDCTNPDTTIACLQGSAPVIDRLSVAPGTYFILIESTSTSATTWTLNVDIRPAMPRNEGDSCDTAIDITNATATVPLGSLVWDHGTSCGGTTTSARDADFVFTLTDVSDVILSTSAGGLHYVAMQGECGNRSTESFCASNTTTFTRRFLRLAAGVYHIAVATALSTGNLTASAMVLPPTYPPSNDSCAAPADLVDGAAFRGDLLAAGDDVASCAATGSPDALQRFVLTEPRNVTAVARRTDGSTEPIFLGLRTVCDAPSSDLVCTSGAPALLNRTLDAGTYYFVVESAASFVGPYSLTMYLADP